MTVRVFHLKQKILRRKISHAKTKTHRGLAKRVKRTGGGGLKRGRAFTSHRFHGKTKNNAVNCVKQAWLQKAITNVSANN